MTANQKRRYNAGVTAQIGDDTSASILNLQGGALDTTDSLLLADAFKANTSVTILNLSDNALASAGAEALAVGQAEPQAARAEVEKASPPADRAAADTVAQLAAAATESRPEAEETAVAVQALSQVVGDIPG